MLLTLWIVTWYQSKYLLRIDSLQGTILIEDFMLFLFRLLRLLFKKVSVTGQGKVLVTDFRVMPTDCDINLHMNNKNYFSFTNLAGIAVLKQWGMLGDLCKRKFTPVIDSQEILYLKSLKPFERFSVCSSVAGYTNQYIYIRHHFVRNSEVVAQISARMVFTENNRKASIPDRVMNNLPSMDSVSSEVLMWEERTNKNRYQTKSFQFS